MKKGQVSKIISLLSLLFCASIPSKMEAQTVIWEKKIIDHYFNVFISSIKDRITPVLSKNELKIISKVNTVLDIDDTISYTANSNSDNRQITFSNKLARYLVRYSVAELIDFDTLTFNRKRFSGFYLSSYPYLNSTIYPEDAAELNERQKIILKQMGDTDDFAWTIKSKLLFIYLHELGHQIQNFTKASREISSQKKLSQTEKDSLMLNLEIEADRFAIDKIVKIHIDPTVNVSNALSFLALAKEQKTTQIEDIIYRKILYFGFCNFSCRCEYAKSDDELCNRIKNGEQENIRLFRHYNGLKNKINTPSKLSTFKKGSNIFDLYNLGDFYLRETEFTALNADSSLVYYSIGANLPTRGDNLFGATSKLQLQQMIEYCQLMSGKIYEIVKKDKVNAILYYKKAMFLSKMFSADYYKAMIDRINKD